MVSILFEVCLEFDYRGLQYPESLSCFNPLRGLSRVRHRAGCKPALMRNCFNPLRGLSRVRPRLIIPCLAAASSFNPLRGLSRVRRSWCAAKQKPCTSFNPLRGLSRVRLGEYVAMMGNRSGFQSSSRFVSSSTIAIHL